MSKPGLIFATRPTTILKLPLAKNTRILHPEQVILMIGELYHDLGAFCYALRSDKQRKPLQPREAVPSSFLEQRPKQVLTLITALSRLITDGGKRLSTVRAYSDTLKSFLDWADAHHLHNCLAGGDATRRAYQGWAEDTAERYRRQEFGAGTHNTRLYYIRELLEATTGQHDLGRGIRRIGMRQNPNRGIEPLPPHDFAHGIALNQALFDGVCELILEQRSFPFKLVLPTTLGWEENHLWIFPTMPWFVPPHQRGTERGSDALRWAYNYTAGQLATVEEIWHRYSAFGNSPADRRRNARRAIQKAQAQIEDANADSRNRVRLMLSMLAHNAFLFLFLCNTGANESVAQEIETDGEIDGATLNQQFRSIKFRAKGKPITLRVPVSFMPSLRRFLELRRHLLANRNFPYLFFTLGRSQQHPAKQVGRHVLSAVYDNVLRVIDPQLPRMGARRLRASVADWYQRKYDSSITAKVLQNTEKTAQRRYNAGSATDHRVEMTLFMTSVSKAAKRQRVIPAEAATATIRLLEEGGRCDGFGHPKALVENVPAQPDCKDIHGCLFCEHRVLVASEEDARKVASAAFVMEQLILGPQHEEALRPLIKKCDDDLEMIAAFQNCRTMVECVRQDVFENGNLTPFFADKYQLFLELGVIA